MVYKTMLQTTNLIAAFDLWIFDLDGTLADSKQDLILAVHHATESIGLTRKSDDEIAGYLASGTMSLVREVLGDDARFAEAFEHFTRHYSDNMLANTRLAPGARALLDVLREEGKTLAIMSNKRERFCRQLVEGLGVADRFVAIVGGDTYPTKKPSPEPLLGILRETGMAPERAIMIGDSPQDAEAARAAGMRSLVVLNGFTSPALLSACGADFIVPSLEEVLPVRR